MNEVMIDRHLGHSDPKVINFTICVDRRKSTSKISTLDTRRASSSIIMATDIVKIPSAYYRMRMITSQTGTSTRYV